ncbi:hypothetical protein [Vibrio cholerae]|uniref:hypothetical protein n=1 Tax=Vibrio cholerae TaxID=666 RepID=UPI0030800FAC
MKLTIFRADHANFKEAEEFSGLYESVLETFIPDVNNASVEQLNAVRELVLCICDAAARDDLIVGTVINGIFWELDELIAYLEQSVERPDLNCADLLERLYQSTPDALFSNAVKELISNLPESIKSQVLTLSESYI